MMTTGKQQLTHTPFLDAWRPSLEAATLERGSKAELARFLESQGRRNFQASSNLVSMILAGRTVPNAEDFLAIDHWIRRRK